MDEVAVSGDRISKSFKNGNDTLSVLEGVSLNVKRGESLAIVGPSGSGKSTLLAILAGFERPTSGEVCIAGLPLSTVSEENLASLRGEKIGFIFQNFQLLPGLTALENVMLPLEIQGRFRAARDKASELLTRVGLGERTKHYPSALSGGEQQRVALARAFVHEPVILFADEPTGNLDPFNAAKVLDTMNELNRTHKTSILLVTHDSKIASMMDYTIRLEAGKLVS